MDNIQSISHTKNLTLNNINKSFGDNHVVKDLSLKVEKGEFVVLLGPSGCGKTTALRMIAGLESVDSGEIEIGDSLVTNKLPKFRNISMVFQSYALYPHKTVSENIAFPLKVRGISGDARDRAILDAAKQVHMEDLLDRYPRQLSGGQRQRVALARAIVRQPDIFLMDEPLSNLDAKLRVHMRTELKRMQHEMGITTVYVTHDQVEAMTLADRIVILNQGNIEQVGTPEEIYNDPANIFVAQFIGTPKMNILEIDEKNVISDNKIKLLGNDIMFDNLKLNKSKHFVGIRPEHLKANQENQFTFNPEIELIENLGNEKIAYMKKEQHQLSAKIPSNIEIGSKIGFDLNDIFIFDENGKRLKS